jgi:hypothetical protein
MMRPVLGVRLRVRSNAEGMVMRLSRVFEPWTTLPPERLGPHRADLDVVVLPATRDALPDRLSYRRHGPLFLAAAGQVQWGVHLDSQHAIVFVPAQVLDDEEWCAAHVAGPGLLAASQRARVPLHAAVVVRDGQAIVLVGESGAGKSTQARACLDAGFDVLCEDTVFVDVSGPVPRLWGHSAWLWLPPESAVFFPDLAGASPMFRANGKRRLRTTAVRAGGRPCLTTDAPATLVVLDRHAERDGLTPIDTVVARSLMTEAVTEGFDQYVEQRPPVDAWLGTRPAWRLAAGGDPGRGAQILASFTMQRAGCGAMP